MNTITLSAPNIRLVATDELNAMQDGGASLILSDEAELSGQKVVALFPEHEVDEFTDYFWDKIQQWRADEGESPSP